MTPRPELTVFPVQIHPFCAFDLVGRIPCFGEVIGVIGLGSANSHMSDDLGDDFG